jgi:hypothetical protein
MAELRQLREQCGAAHPEVFVARPRGQPLQCAARLPDDAGDDLAGEPVDVRPGLRAPDKADEPWQIALVQQLRASRQERDATRTKLEHVGGPELVDDPSQLGPRELRMLLCEVARRLSYLRHHRADETQVTSQVSLLPDSALDRGVLAAATFEEAARRARRGRRHRPISSSQRPIAASSMPATSSSSSSTTSTGTRRT